MAKSKNSAAGALGRKGGKKRMAGMTKLERSALGKTAAAKRWDTPERTRKAS